MHIEMQSKESTQKNQHDWHSEWIEIGQIAGAHGIKGEVKVQTFSRHPKDVLQYDQWWLMFEHPEPFLIEEGRVSKNHQVVVRFKKVKDRNQAETLKGVMVVVKASQLPKLPEGEYYWRDVMGLKVVNQNDEVLGKVTKIHETGANDVLQIDGNEERLIPWVDQFVKRIDLENGIIRVDWEDVE